VPDGEKGGGPPRPGTCFIGKKRRGTAQRGSKGGNGEFSWVMALSLWRKGGVFKGGGSPRKLMVKKEEKKTITEPREKK